MPNSLRDLIYAVPSDNIAHRVPASTSSSGVSGSTPLANIYDRDPASVITMTGASPWWLRWDFSGLSGYGPIKWLVFLNLQWLANGTRTITFQANSSDSWGAPPITLATAPPAASADFYWPQNFAVDLTSLGAYTNAHNWVRLLFTDSGAGAAPTIGEVLLYTARRTILDFAPGVSHTRRYPHVLYRTPAGRRLAYSHDVRERVLEGRQLWSATDWAALELLASDARGPVLPFAVQRGDTEPLFVTLDGDLVGSRAAHRYETSVRFLEVMTDRVA